MSSFGYLEHPCPQQVLVGAVSRCVPQRPLNPKQEHTHDNSAEPHVSLTETKHWETNRCKSYSEHPNLSVTSSATLPPKLFTGRKWLQPEVSPQFKLLRQDSSPHLPSQCACAPTVPFVVSLLTGETFVWYSSNNLWRLVLYSLKCFSPRCTLFKRNEIRQALKHGFLHKGNRRQILSCCQVFFVYFPF